MIYDQEADHSGDLWEKNKNFKKTFDEKFKAQMAINTVAESICKVDWNSKEKITIFYRIRSKVSYYLWIIKDFISYIKKYGKNDY